MIQCEECQTDTIVKNGIGPEKQRHQCKSCSGNFIVADFVINPATWISGEKGHNDLNGQVTRSKSISTLTG